MRSSILVLMVAVLMSGCATSSMEVAMKVGEIQGNVQTTANAVNNMAKIVTSNRNGLSQMAKRIDGVAQNHNELVGAAKALDNRGAVADNAHRNAIILIEKAMEMQYGEDKWKAMIDAASAKIEADAAKAIAEFKAKKAEEAAEIKKKVEDSAKPEKKPVVKSEEKIEEKAKPEPKVSK